MKTKSVLDKYRRIISGLLNEDPKNVQFFVGETGLCPGNLNPASNYLYKLKDLLDQGKLKEIKRVVYYEPEKDKNGNKTGKKIRNTRWENWSEGCYSVVVNNELVSTFELYKMPHCCAILISCKSFVYEKFRNKRIATTLNTMRQDLGRLLGYSLLMCTDVESNTYQRQLLETNGWKGIYNIKNKRTNNQVHIHVINL